MRKLLLLLPFFVFLSLFFPQSSFASTGTFHVDNLGMSWTLPTTYGATFNLQWSNFSPPLGNFLRIGFYNTAVGSAYWDYQSGDPGCISCSPSNASVLWYTRDQDLTDGQITYFHIWNSDFSKDWVSQFYQYNKSTQTFTEISNVPPTINPITTTSSPLSVNSTVSATATFTDFNPFDTHTAVWNWGDGNSSSGTVTESDGAGSVTNNHIYSNPGVYTVTLSVTDSNGGVGTSTYQYIVIYDQSAGFVTGSGSFDTPPGSYPANPSFIGKTHFGFNTKYKLDGSLEGKTKMDWKPNTTGIDLDSLTYQWLVVNGNRAEFKGMGSIMDQGSYTFLLTTIDGGKIDSDRLRIKITNNADNSVVYDTQMGDPDNADPKMIITKGQIKIHNN